MLRRLWAREEGRYRGGWKQRLAQGEGAGEDNEPSQLCSGLLLDWADGLMSACRLQAHVERAEHDGLRHPMVRRLAALPKGMRAQQGLRKLFMDLGLVGLQTTVENPDAVTKRALGRVPG